MAKRKIYAEVDEKKIHGIGEKIKTIRELKGLTLEQFGKKLGCSKQFAHYLENADNMTLGSLIAICRVLEVTPNTLLGYDAELDLWFKQLAQNCFEIVHGHEKWMEVFGKNYL